MTNASLPASGVMVCLNPLKTSRCHLHPAVCAVACVTRSLDLAGLKLPTGRLEVRSLGAGAGPGAEEVAGSRRGGTGWHLPVSKQRNLGLGWGLELPGVMASGCAHPLPHPIGAWCYWRLAGCELKVGYFNKDQPFKTCCRLSRQIFLSPG